MPIYNFGNGINGVYTYNNGIYSYSNGNFTSNTTFVNGMPYTQNIMMLNGTGSGCGEVPCTQGYSLYFPCLKNVTRGEDVCFDFYVVDNVTKDVVDLRKVDGLTITLGGAFGCTLGTYMYPSDDNYIRPLQTQEYKSVLNEEFKERPYCYLTVVSVDGEMNEILENGIEGSVGKFYKDDIVKFEAFDTESYIFVGWIDLDEENDDECDDYYLSLDRVLSFSIQSDRNIAAVYRKRRKFKINIDETNSFYSYYKNGEEYPVNKGFTFYEGKHILVRSIPTNCIFSNWDTSLFGESKYTNKENIIMEIEVLSDITLKIDKIETVNKDDSDDIIGSFGVDYFDLNFIGFSFDTLISAFDIEPNKDEFEEKVLTENKPYTGLVYRDDIESIDFFTECKPVSYDNLHCYYMGNNCILKFGDKNANGYLELSNPGLENETVVEVFCMRYDNDVDCSVSVSLDGKESQTQDIYDNEIDRLVYHFENTGFNTLKISTLGEIFPEEKPSYCMIDRIDISDLIIIDKGKATLCLPGSVTAKFFRGKITATGAISINGSTHGIPCTMVGNVNGNPIINII